MSSPVVRLLVLLLLLGFGGCSVDREPGELEWVSALRPGDCVDPGAPAATVLRVRVVPCHQRHAMEVYARLPYPPTATPAPPTAAASAIEYPGRDVLRSFARESCAANFRGYLGDGPRKSSYFLTYLFPSVSSWSAASAQRPKLGPLRRLITASAKADRSVVCFVRTTGPPLTASVRSPGHTVTGTSGTGTSGIGTSGTGTSGTGTPRDRPTGPEGRGGR